jgi:hypothetical protein
MSHAPKFYLIQEGDGGPDVLHSFDTQPERDAATIKLIFGEDISTQDEAEQWDKMREELNEKGSLSFEGDPGLSWFTAIPDDSFIALARWKEEAMQVEAQWDCQAIGKLIDVPLGHHIRPRVEPAIRELIAQRDRARLIMEVALLRFSRWSLRQGESHKMPRTGIYPPAVQSVMDKMREFLSQGGSPVPPDYVMNNDTRWWKFETLMPESPTAPIQLMNHITGQITQHPAGGYEHVDEDLWSPL